MTIAGLAVAAAAVLAWLLVSKQATRSNISAALALVALGVILGNGPLAVIHDDLQAESIRQLAEATLALVLFADASRVDVKRLRADVAIPARLLAIGLPLTMVLGAGVSLLVLPNTGVWVAATIATIVAPTDAALGAPILADRRVPARIRRALNVESGLNDGIATPFVNVCLAAALGTVGGNHGVRTAVAHLVVGAVVGLVVGGGGGCLIRAARRHHVMERAAAPLATLGLAALSFAGAVAIHGNGFIAAFVAGLAFATTTSTEEPTGELTTQVAEGMTLVVWFVFGAALLVPAVQDAQWGDVVFAVLALTVVRMLPVALALAGTGLDRMTVLVVGWFGPRGLASVVFTLIAVDTLDTTDGRRVLSAVSITVALSVLAHGVSASPLAAIYGRRAVDGDGDPNPHGAP